MQQFDFSKITKEQLDGLKQEEREAVLKILDEFTKTGASQTLNKLVYADYDEIPADIHTFLHDRKYLGNALYDQDNRFTVYPYWEKKLEEIFPDNITTRYNTVILTGAIGLGKTFIGVICLLYMLHRLLCLKDPYLYYGLQSIDKLSISFMNITIENAKGVALDKMNQLIMASEWFMAHGKMAGETNLIYRPNKHIEVIAASSNNQIIGRCLFGSLEDEVNFSAMTTNVEKTKKRMLDIITKVDARMKSRFLRTKNGEPYLPTLNIIISSKNSEQSFLESYIETKKKNESKTTLIVDEPQWVVDTRKDSKLKFYVAVGNKFLANELLPLNADEATIESFRAKGYGILPVPIGYLENFQDNIDGALTDIAGISTASSLKYINGQRWNTLKTDSYVNPFTKDIITSGIDDEHQYSEWFDITTVSPDIKAKPMYVHLDMSKSGDKTGIAGITVLGKRAGSGSKEAKSLFYHLTFSTSIQAPTGSQISFIKNRAFVKWLRNQGFNIKGVSSDTYQAAQIHQELMADGFNVATVSVDRLTDIGDGKKDCVPYTTFKSAITDKRLEIYQKCDLLTEEVIGLEREADGHINHPENGTVGSKDQVDAVCGALYNASQHVEDFTYDYGESADLMMEVNDKKDDAAQVVVDFDNLVKQMALAQMGMIPEKVAPAASVVSSSEPAETTNHPTVAKPPGLGPVKSNPEGEQYKKIMASKDILIW